MPTYAKLKGRIIEKFGSQKAFAEKIGLSQTSMSRKMNCETGFSQEDIIRWADILEIDRADYGAYFFT